ncbi:MAG: NADH-ubiquinone oxidoreductase-F iron-sulfur binding region domain-containing protein [Bacteroidales bacterium]
MEKNGPTKYKDVLLNEVLGQPAEKIKEHQNILNKILRYKIDKPFIALTYTSSSIIAGAEESYKAIETYLEERDMDVELIKVGSGGLCSQEPFMDVQLPGKAKISFNRVTADKVSHILDAIFNSYLPEEEVFGQYKNELHEPWENVPFVNEHPFFKEQNRLILNNCGTINPESLNEYIASGGYQNFMKVIRNYTPEEVCDLITEAQLRGRGGEGYPTGKKWKNTLNSRGEQRYLICNAGESDPGAFMERTIMESDPHNVLESIAIASYAIGAQKAVIYLESEYDLAYNRLNKAIGIAKSSGILGHDIFNSGFSLNISIFRGAGAYVCGEETALIASMEGKRGMPRTKPPYPSQKGFAGHPTALNNLETLLNVPIILNYGPEWYLKTGSENSKGTKIFSLSGSIERTGMIEIPMGTPVRDIIYRIGGGLPDNMDLKGVLAGGPAGGIIQYEHLDTQIDYESIRELGCSLGSGGLVVLNQDNCIIDTVKYYMSYLKQESCGKCIPCREGTARMHEILENISKKPQDENGHTTLQRFKGVMNLEKLAEVIRDTSLCGLGQRAANPVLSTLRWFRDEYEEHIFDRNCEAGVCRDLRTYYIDVDKCTGCAICAKKCPAGAIFGTLKKAHFIVQEKCIGCGDCYEVCKFNAIITQ